MSRIIVNKDRTCLGFDQDDMKRYQGTDAPGDPRAMAPGAIAAIKSGAHEGKMMQWLNGAVFVTACGEFVRPVRFGEGVPTCMACQAGA